MERDLQLQCLYEVLKSRASIAQLESYCGKYKIAKQKENAQKRIGKEQKRQDWFMSLALELDDEHPRSPTHPTPTSSNVRKII